MNSEEVFTEVTRNSRCFDFSTERLSGELEGEIVGIEGPSASGKTTLARKMADEMGGSHIKLDDYWKHSRDEMSSLGITGYDWSSRKTKKLLEDLQEIRSGTRTIQKPKMDPGEEKPLEETETININRPVFIEGTLNHSRLVDEFLFCWAPDEILVRRRLERDNNQNRLKDIEQYIRNKSMPAYRRQHLPDINEAHIVVNTHTDRAHMIS
jgi:uridine kinase